METVLSHHGVPIRLTAERWMHIVENHDDLAGMMYETLEVVAEPDIIARGKNGELLAIQTQRKPALVVVYRERSRSDGFIITAFRTSKPEHLIKTRRVVWQAQESKKHSA